ncbi:NAD(P)-dependent oxidoreductase [Nonomuraea roseoviolacea]|uniref:3-hydroxyisobutyrate dehydrogenase-like beta-hydroxyacid dehydrogenase n=1 Tax=Nonomuraea roseoviolacea subsp. carminata TaxID=160689 RepID=A0ABT1K4J4_9ACTN|nr:NAD(P)-binding domain-containing protein [Nonomuraea roseoviolacea]MCP2348366.1 3-hydroxyisobutyrate dehydrogenase-like beta-hydroxyacid dehydrogenase [Nonomuraea roseoviolacea subsp. carminata]
MTDVTVIGLGPMGATMAATFLAAGHDVTVWNRTASKAEPLVAKGARLAASPGDSGELLVISQLDYQAMYDSFGDLRLDGKVLVNLSSGTPEELRAAARWVAERGGTLVTAGIMVPPPGIGQPGAYAFYSGPQDAVDRHADTLRALGDVHYMGADEGLAMMFYQAQLLVFWSSLTSYLHALALLGSAGVEPAVFLPYAREMFTLLGGDGPMGFAKILAEEVAAGTYPGELNSLTMQAVGIGHVVHALRDAGVETTVPGALKALFERAAFTEGRGGEGLGTVFESIRKP